MTLEKRDLRFSVSPCESHVLRNLRYLLPEQHPAEKRADSGERRQIHEARTDVHRPGDRQRWQVAKPLRSPRAAVLERCILSLNPPE